MKLSYPISLLAAVALFTATSASAQDNTTSLKEDFFPRGNVTPQMAEAIEAIPYAPARPALPGAQKAPAYDGGMSGDWRPSVVTTAGEKGDNMYKYMYYFDKKGTYYSKDQSQVRIYQTWNATDNIWDNRMRLKLIIDDRGDIIEGFTDNGFKDQWNNNFRCTYTYDDNHNMLTAEQYTWYEDEWFSTLKWENVYDSEGRLITQTYFNRPLGNQEWAKGSQYTWTYDAAGNMTLYEIAHWSDVSQKYSTYLSQQYTYNEAGNILTESQENYGNLNYLYTYTYDESGDRKLTFLHQKWNGSEWTDYLMTDYTYDDQGRLKEEVSKLWENDAWNNSRRTAYVYWELADQETYSIWDVENQKWKDTSNRVVRRDAEGHVIGIANGELDESNGHIQTQKQEVFEYQDNLLVCKKIQDWNGPELKFDDISYFAFTYNDDRNCNNVTATAKQSKEWIIAPYNNMADEWGCPDYEPWIGNLEYLNVNDYVEPTGITLNESEVTLEPDFSKQLTATVAPANASNPEYYWTSSDETVARVSVGGKVYALAKGEATITATTMDNRFTAQCLVKVGQSGIAETVAEGSFAYTDGQIIFTPANECHSISVFDISGKAVCLDDARTAISTSEWAPGLYIVKTTDGTAVKAYKIIVK